MFIDQPSLMMWCVVRRRTWSSSPRRRSEARASGQGKVYATSLVCRAATPETRAHVPYNILLVDCAEGFRMMAHGEANLAIGDEVTASFKPFAGKLVPLFAKRTW